MVSRSIKNRLSDSTNIWPGFVDVLATLLIVIIFVLMVFTVSQIYLSDAISGRDKALQDLREKITELSKILVIETSEKEKAISDLSETSKELSETKKNLQSEEFLSEQLQAEISKKSSEIFVQEQNLLALSDQITSLLKELRIVAGALETYEGIETPLIETEGLGEKINKALAVRIDQLKDLNEKLDITNNKLSISETNLQNKILELTQVNEKLALSENKLQDKIIELSEKNKNLEAISESLGLNDNDIAKQLDAIKNKNENLTNLNAKLALRDEELQDQITQYQELTNDLLTINDSLGLKDATLKEQLDAIRFKNQELSRLNNNLIQKDNTIFDLRGKILELNNILSLSEEKQIAQNSKILTLENEISNLNNLNKMEKDISLNKIKEMELRSSETLKQVSKLSNEIEILKNEINILNNALEANEQEMLTKDLKIDVLGEKLNKALTSKVFELQKYRSEFFGKLQSILGERDDIKVVGDRFIFESELLFDSGSADLQIKGKEKLKEIGISLKETTLQIPEDIDWIIQLEGHTDKRPIKTLRYPSNWELSSARANSVLKLLLEIGFSPNRLAAAGYGEFYPISEGNTEKDFQQNRRIELKLTSR